MALIQQIASALIAVAPWLPIAIGNQALAIDNADGEAAKLVREAKSLVNRKDYATAIERCSRALAVDGRNEEALLARAVALRELKRFDESDKDFSALLRLQPNSRAALVERAELRVQTKRRGDAIRDYSAAIDLNNLDAIALAGRARCRYAIGDFAAAIDDAKAAVAFDPKNPTLRELSGTIHLALGDLQSAVEDYTEQIRLSPDNLEAYLGRAECYYHLGDFTRLVDDSNTAIKKRPDDPASYMRRGYAMLNLHNYDKALADAERIIALDKTVPEGYAIRAAYRAQNGSFADASNDFQLAMKCRSDDVGRLYDKRVKHAITLDDIRHGEQQVAEMLKDRREMARHVTKGDALWTWAARQFAGESLGRRMRWDRREPPIGFSASSSRPDDDSVGSIRVTSGDHKAPPRSAEDLWSLAVLELHNAVQSQKNGPDIEARVYAGTLDQYGYVNEVLRSEHTAVQEVHAFYASVYLPWAKAKGLRSSDARLWYSNFWPAFNESPRPSPADAGHRKSYMKDYEFFVAAGLVRKGSYREAIAKAQALLKSTPEPASPGEVYDLLALAYLQLDELDNAGKASDEAIRLFPSESQFYIRRAEILRKRGDIDQSSEAIDRAIKLGSVNPDAFWLRGALHEDRRQFDRSIDDYTAALKLRPRSALARFSRGRVLSIQGEYAKAIADFDAVLSIDPTMKDALYARSSAWAEAGDTDKGLRDVRSLLKVDPKYTEAYYLQADIFIKREEFEEALASLDAYIRRAPSDPKGYGARAFVQCSPMDKQVYNPTKALADAKKACELSQSKDAQLLSILAAAYAESGNFADAIATQERAIENATDGQRTELQENLALYRRQESESRRPKKLQSP